uniref:Uncharacterized protein n=1 Tax=Parastrongyloides trichosuri TaxID=131310 RepID=A0A0N4ZV72_PARTI
MKLLYFLLVTYSQLLESFWWGCCSGCSYCGGGIAYQPTFSNINVPIYQKVEAQPYPIQPQEPIVVIHRKTIIKEIPNSEEYEEVEEPRYIMKRRRIPIEYEDYRPRHNYMDNGEYRQPPVNYNPPPTEKIIYIQPPNNVQPSNYGSSYIPPTETMNTNTFQQGYQNPQMTQQKEYKRII